MCKSIISAMVCAVLLLVPGIASAGSAVTYKDGDRALFRIDVPDFWTLRTGGLRELSDPEIDDQRDVSRVFGMTPDAHPGVWVGIISPHGVRTLAEARDYLQDIGPFLVKEADVTEAVPQRIGGLPARSLSGVGVRNGKQIDFTVLAIDLPGARVAIAVVVFEEGADTTPVGDINTMLRSIRAVR
jgi:hypothetical protein